MRHQIQLCLLVALLLWLPAVVRAQFTFTTNNDVITIMGYTGAGGVVIIPGTTNGYPVASIGMNAFASKFLSKVIIPNSVTNVGSGAFNGAYGLTNISVGSGVTNIGVLAFNNCRSLTAITVNPTNLFFSSTNGVLFNKNQTTLLQYPSGLGGSYAVPSGVTTIGGSAFADSIRLTNVFIGSSVTNIGFWAFLYCISLTAFSVDTNNPVFSSVNGVLFDKQQTTLEIYPPGVGGNYIIPAGVTTVLDYSFSYCNNLLTVTVPASVTLMDWNTFIYCGALTGVYFLGNAPDTGGFNPFDYTSPTVYYLPGSTGWVTFAADTGVPQMPWLPQIQPAAGGFGGLTNAFGFNLNWASGQTVVVEASADLMNWQPLLTNTLTGGTAYFSDAAWSNYSSRFYRLRSP